MPLSDTCSGEDSFQIIPSEILTAMNKLIPFPIPYLFINSSISMTMIDAKTSCNMTIIALNMPILSILP